MHPFIGNFIVEVNDNSIAVIISNNRSKDDDVVEEIVVILTPFINAFSITSMFSSFYEEV